ncbi:AAA family ATPase [Xanthomonas oryzae]|uniref:AAA family ATPase n=1 Tax=Xanthomonas oryzae TaxID=347 RepID=UPI003DA1C5BE
MNVVDSNAIVEFAEAALAADYTRLRKVGQRLARELDVCDVEGARRLRLALSKKGVPLQASGFTEMLPVDAKSRLPLVEEHSWPSAPTFLSQPAREQYENFLSDAENYSLLAAKGIASRLSLLLSGPPGTGKTLIAGQIAAQMGRKLYVARLDSVISSMLGDTAKNIRAIFDFVAGKNAVLFLDELDALAKMRDDRNELGELKRVVNTVIQGIDSLDAEAVVIGATNHPQMLDAAIWRRFSYKINFSLPDFDLRQALWAYFLGDNEDLSGNANILAHLSEGLTGADIEQLALASRRRAVVESKEIDWMALALRTLQENRANSDMAATNATDARKLLTQELVNRFRAAQSDVARFLKISRQTVSAYLKG